MASPQTSKDEGIFRAHDMRKKVFVLPTWCDTCAGILVGTGYECTGPCKLRCHRGLGDKASENCRADMLLKPCEAGAVHAQGSYHFGDISRQMRRDAKQKVKDVVLTEFVKEQRGFGKFDRLREQVHGLASWWDDTNVILRLVGLQLVTVVFTVAVASGLVHTFGRGPLTSQQARLHATYSLSLLIFHEVVLFLVARILAMGMLRYSDLIHTFVHEVLNIDLTEVEINLDDAARAVLRVVNQMLLISAALFVVSAAAWVAALQTAS
mmetsp:Transcript_38000/g.104506  ORF Transcript_38000/g.104506 Transcript_38000/m.104506 type:complete len:266 (-) Transcript_38000:91-888(-)